MGAKVILRAIANMKAYRFRLTMILVSVYADILQVLVNPDTDSYWNISTAVNNLEDLNFMVLHEKSDVVLEKWIATLRGKPSRLSR